MKVCVNCFSDKELKGFISSSSVIGDCAVCESNNQQLLDVSELFDFFQELVDNFKIEENGIPLSSKIQSNWSFFSTHYTANKILKYVLPKLKTKVISPNINVEYTDDIRENYNHWEILKEELKWKNRFVIDIYKLGKDKFNWDNFLKDFNSQDILTPKNKLFRARINSQEGNHIFKKKDMGCPPKEITKGGRANPTGIPFLYLSEDEDTVLYEIRASFLDEISVAKFKLSKGIELIKIVDFTKESPLFQPDNIKETIKGKLLRDRISEDLSKPMRRYDSELEYIPTQFICEYIKVFTDAQGIRFKSSLNKKGNNVVLFDQNLMTCTSVKKVKINSVNLQGMELKH